MSDPNTFAVDVIDAKLEELRALRESHAELLAALVTCERKLPLGAFSGRADLKTKDRCARCGHFTDTKDGICGPCVLVEKAEAL